MAPPHLPPATDTTPRCVPLLICPTPHSIWARTPPPLSAPSPPAACAAHAISSPPSRSGFTQWVPHPPIRARALSPSAPTPLPAARTPRSTPAHRIPHCPYRSVGVAASAPTPSSIARHAPSPPPPPPHRSFIAFLPRPGLCFLVPSACAERPRRAPPPPHCSAYEGVSPPTNEFVRVRLTAAARLRLCQGLLLTFVRVCPVACDCRSIPARFPCPAPRAPHFDARSRSLPSVLPRT